MDARLIFRLDASVARELYRVIRVVLDLFGCRIKNNYTWKAFLLLNISYLLNILNLYFVLDLKLLYIIAGVGYSAKVDLLREGKLLHATSW